MDLHADVFAGAERAAHAREVKAHLFRREVEAGGELLEIGVQPLRGDEQVDAAIGCRHGEPRFGAQWCLVLHAGLVHPFHPDVRPRLGIAVDDRQRANDVALGMNRGRALLERLLHVRDPR